MTQLLGSSSLPSFDIRGHTEISFGIPNNPALQGLDLGFQAVALDAASPVGFGLSHALQLVFGQ